MGTITGQGKKNLVEITVDTDGTAGDATDTVTATDGHPFWLPETRVWARADQLVAGSVLQTSAGTRVQVTALRQWTAQERVHNLTVAKDHTYYVLVGTVPVLVHNCGGEGPLDHVALGMRDSDLKGFSDNVQARNLLGALSDSWRSEVTAAIDRVGRGEGRISFMLDGLPGAGSGQLGRWQLHRRLTLMHFFTRSGNSFRWMLLG